MATTVPNRTALIVSPHLYLADVTGRPLDYGRVYFGEPNKDGEFYPINIFSDKELTEPLAQPVYTKGGFLQNNGDITEVFAYEGVYSVKVLDQYGRKIFFKGEVAKQTIEDAASDVVDAAQVEVNKRMEQLDGAINAAAAAGAGANGWTATLVTDVSGRTQQQINDILIDPLSKEKVKGDGVYRNIADLWTTGTESYRFTSRTAAESYLGFNITTELVNAGLDTTVDTAYLQMYIIKAYNLFLTTGIPQTILLKNSASYNILGLQLYPGVNLISQGQTEFKKRPALTVTNEATLKWWRIAVSKASVFATDAATKHRCIIKGIKFNGNMSNMNWTYNTYNQEQAASLTISASNGSTKDIRAKFDLKDLEFTDSVADGLHIVQNADVTFSNIKALNCFRGGLVITGGNSLIVGDNVTANNARADMEVDTAGFGGSYNIYVSLKNYFQDIGGKIGDFSGGCDLGGYADSEFYFDNFHVHTQPTNIMTGSGSSKAKSFIIKNSTLTVGVGSSSGNRIFNPCKNMLFENVKFNLVNSGFLSIFTVYNSYSTTDDYVFKNCTTEITDGSAAALQTYRIESQLNTATGRQIIEGGNYAAPTQYLVTHTLGGKTVLDNVRHAMTSAIVYRGFTTNYPSDVTVKRVNQDSAAVPIFTAYNSGAVSADSLTELTEDAKFKSELNVNTTTTLGTLKNKRTVYGDAPPTATTQSFLGDRYVLNTPVAGKPYEWVATTTSKTASAYYATKWLTGAFATANLPTLTAFDVGVTNFDTTTNTFKRWSGTAWI